MSSFQGRNKVVIWSGRVDLNHRPLRSERNALPDCATPRPVMPPATENFSSASSCLTQVLYSELHRRPPEWHLWLAWITSRYLTSDITVRELIFYYLTTFNTNYSQNCTALYSHVPVGHSCLPVFKLDADQGVQGLYFKWDLSPAKNKVRSTTQVCADFKTGLMNNVPYRKYVLLVRLDSIHCCTSI